MRGKYFSPWKGNEPNVCPRSPGGDGMRGRPSAPTSCGTGNFFWASGLSGEGVVVLLVFWGVWKEPAVRISNKRPYGCVMMFLSYGVSWNNEPGILHTRGYSFWGFTYSAFIMLILPAPFFKLTRFVILVFHVLSLSLHCFTLFSFAHPLIPFHSLNFLVIRPLSASAISPPLSPQHETVFALPLAWRRSRFLSFC